MRLNWFYIFVFVLLAGMLFISFRFFRSSKNSSIGVTHARPYKINAETASIVKQIVIIPGQQVKKGDLLIQLTSSGLEIEIAKMTEKIKTIEAEMREKEKLAQSEISFLKADRGIAIEEINSDISEAETELSLNRRLSERFSTSRDTASAGDPVRAKLSALKKQKEKIEQAIEIKEKDILQQKTTAQKLLSDQVTLLQQELDFKNEQRKALSKYAAADGVIENIYVRPGEEIDAYTALLSIHPVRPTTVIAYLIGKTNSAEIGAEVQVASYERPSNETKGKVIGYGAVVELPQILQKSTAVKAFGREMFIEVPETNGLATGEKVLVR